MGTEQTFEKAARNWHVIFCLFLFALKLYEISRFSILQNSYTNWILYKKGIVVWLQISPAAIMLNIITRSSANAKRTAQPLQKY